MTNQTTHKRQMFLFDVHAETAAGFIGDWTAVTASPEAAHILVQRRLLSYFGAGLLKKLPRHSEFKITQNPEASAETLKNPGLHTEKVTCPAQTFTTIF